MVSRAARGWSAGSTQYSRVGVELAVGGAGVMVDERDEGLVDQRQVDLAGDHGGDAGRRFGLGQPDPVSGITLGEGADDRGAERGRHRWEARQAQFADGVGVERGDLLGGLT
jgi:hypothetical protein